MLKLSREARLEKLIKVPYNTTNEATIHQMYHLLRYPMEWTSLLSLFYRAETGLKGKK